MDRICKIFLHTGKCRTIFIISYITYKGRTIIMCVYISSDLVYITVVGYGFIVDVKWRVHYNYCLFTISNSVDLKWCIF